MDMTRAQLTTITNMKILVTGGPVHAKLDAVKIITNSFRGGMMADLADRLKSADINNVEITYLTAKHSKVPCLNGPTILYHDGFPDYFKQVVELAPKFDAVILGAAVANLIPKNPLTGKFPSHNYKVGDTIPIDFTIAPRVIDEVKKVAPKTHLFGFKLLSGVPYDELISAAYGVLLESHATAVFANDRKDLWTKYAVTKERGVHPMGFDDMAQFILQCVRDKYYQTTVMNAKAVYPDAERAFHWYRACFGDKYQPIPEGLVFGTIAIRNPDGTFLTTTRGKDELADLVVVQSVHHTKLEVKTYGKKATLNAPLIDWVFKHNQKCHAIVHYHQRREDVNLTLPYAIPGTVNDSQREFVSTQQSFNIADHGCFLLFDKERNMIV
jgi:hypothetical protein